MKKIIQWYNLLTEKGMLDLDEEAKEKAQQQGITVFSSNSNSYQVAVQLSRLLSE